MSTASGEAGARTDDASRRQKKRKKRFHDRYRGSLPPTLPFNARSENGFSDLRVHREVRFRGLLDR
jgi:hypothetical protein